MKSIIKGLLKGIVTADRKTGDTISVLEEQLAKLANYFSYSIFYVKDKKGTLRRCGSA